MDQRTVEAMASICHEANRAICETFGDPSQTPWNSAPDWQRASAIDGVQYRLAHPEAPASAQHDAWCRDKTAAGWRWGQEKDADLRTHPCLVPFESLPAEQRVKDAVFAAIVTAIVTATKA